MTFAGLLYHVDSSLCIRIFPAGLNNKIDWTSATFSEKDFAFYNFKESQRKENYIEFSNAEELNIHPLRLKETVRYKCRIETKNKADTYNYTPHIKNEDNKLLKIERDEKNSFTFQFINYLGKTSIVFNDGQKECSFEFEVVPDKINYEEDYVNLTEAISEECSALLHDYTSPTLLSYLQDSSRDANILEQFIFLRKFCNSDNLESLFASIKQNPDRLLIRDEEMKPFGTGIPSSKFFANPFSYSRGWQKTSGGTYLPSEVAVIHKYDSYDTPANRFIKFALSTFSDVCNKLLECVDIKDGSKYFPEAQKIIEQIDDIFCDSFFDDIGELEIMPVNNQVLEKREGYIQIFNAFAMIYLALQLNWKDKDTFSAEVKNTALLYEYWLFFELRKILGELSYETNGENKNSSWIPFTRFIEDKENNGLTISLAQGNSSVQSFSFDKLTVNLYYNKTFSPMEFSNSLYWGSYSRPFRPDYTLAIFPSNCKKETDAIKKGSVTYIHFDAKYRIEDLTQFINSDRKSISESVIENSEQDISEQEENEFEQEKSDEIVNTYKRGDLLKMHTYNDAIRRTVGSYVLYPGTNNNSNRKKQPSVYDEILPGVGAFAIRPGNENAGHNAIKDFIKKIIDFKSNEASRKCRATYFENMVISSPSEEKPLSVEKTEKEYQMIGFIRNEYFAFLQANHLIPVTKQDFVSSSCQSIYFYFYAIKSGKVYTIHKETSKAKYLRLTNTDINNCKFENGYKFLHLLPWEAEIESMELVSKEKLAEKLNSLYNLSFNPKNGFQADYYYLVKANIVRFSDNGIQAISTNENDDISVYSPKIIERIV